jgi:hypothetical protein
MVTPVRNPLIPVGPGAKPAARPDVTAAQRAFFEAAMGKAGAPVQAQAQAPITAATAAAETRPARGLDLTQPPPRILPPGSLLNIKV